MILLMSGPIAKYLHWMKMEDQPEWREFHLMHLVLMVNYGACQYLNGMC
jgi:hypothetical protein